MEQLRGTPPRPATPPSAGDSLTQAACDVARLAHEASARADAVPLVPAVLTVAVKTTSAQAARIVATPDTTVGEVMAQACTDLGVHDPARYVLVANGEVVGDRGRTLRDLVGEQLGAELTARLVKRPEAGRRPSCPS